MGSEAEERAVAYEDVVRMLSVEADAVRVDADALGVMLGAPPLSAPVLELGSCSTSTGFKPSALLGRLQLRPVPGISVCERARRREVAGRESRRGGGSSAGIGGVGGFGDADGVANEAVAVTVCNKDEDAAEKSCDAYGGIDAGDAPEGIRPRGAVEGAPEGLGFECGIEGAFEAFGLRFEGEDDAGGGGGARAGGGGRPSTTVSAFTASSKNRG